MASLALASLTLLTACAGPASATPDRQEPASAMRVDSSRYIVLAVDNPLENPAGRAGSSLGAYAPPPRYVLGSRAASQLAALAGEYHLRETAGWPIAALGWHCVVFELPAGSSRDAVLAALSHDPRVRLAQPLQDFDTQAAPAAASAPSSDSGLIYNDPYVNLQHGFVDTGAARAHRLSTGSGIQIALVDTGAATDHPDLRGKFSGVRDLVGETTGQTMEAERHGTEVAGIIAAVGNNREGIVGIAPEARLQLYRACWPLAAGAGRSAARCNSFTLAKALAAVLNSDARIVNLSLGGPHDPLLERLLGELLSQGRIVVGALPPDGHRGGFPTGTPGVLAAGIAGEFDAQAVDVLAAPGRDVLTLEPGGRYDYASGSSIAAAHVSGVAALLLAAQPKLDRVAVAALLGGHDGHSLLHADAAVEALQPVHPARR